MTAIAALRDLTRSSFASRRRVDELSKISFLRLATWQQNHCNLKSALGEKNISSRGRFSSSRARFRSF